MKREPKEQSAKNQPFGLKSDYDMNAAPEPDKVKAGPNQFAMMKDRMQFYGRDFDYRVMDQDVFMPASKIAQEWIRLKVGEDQHWYQDLDGWFGVAVTDLETIKVAADRDGLIDEETYVANMENDELMRSGE